MEPTAGSGPGALTRREVLRMGSLGLAGVGLSTVLITNAIDAATAVPAARGAAPQPPPSIIRSSGGVLRGALTLAETDAWVAGDTASGFLTYDGRCPGPVLWADPGDRVLLDITNATSQMTNTHFHGLHVTPEGQGDNVFAHVMPGETFHHDFVIPADHPGGLNWYHPHMHGLTDVQLYHGLVGLFVISGGAAALPALADKAHVLMAIRNTAIEGVAPDRVLVAKGAQEQIQTLNGDVDAPLAIAPGETQLWQIGNLSNEAYLLLELDGHRLTVVAEDGRLLWQTYETDQVLLPPGKRFEVAVTGGPPGSYAFRQVGYVEGDFGQWPAQVLATLTSSGPAQLPAVIPPNPVPRDDLADEPIAARRTITMSERDSDKEGEGKFFMNDVMFQDMTPADVIQVTLGTTEEWVIRNDPSLDTDGSPEEHPFHLHVNHMVLTGVGTWDPATGAATTYEPVDSPGKVDTVSVKPGEYAVVRVRFDDFPGLTVYHCHILDHEDKGMMGQVDVNLPVPAPTPADPVPATPTFTG